MVYYHIPFLFWKCFTIMLLITFKWCPLPFFLRPHPPQKREKMHPSWICRARLHGHFSSSGGSNMIRLRNVSPPHPSKATSLLCRVPFIQRKRAGPKQAHLQHSARAVGHLEGEEGRKCVCVCEKGKEEGGRLHSKWHLMLVSSQCCLINHAGLNLTKSATELDVWCWWAPVDSF